MERPRNPIGGGFAVNGWSLAPRYDLLTCRWQRFDTVHSAVLETGQPHAGRQTRPIFRKEDKTALRQANHEPVRQRRVA